MTDHSSIEEGLASLNQLYENASDLNKPPFLYKAALHYFSAVCASTMSFQQLFQTLEKYIHDRQERWQECVRVKRGIQNTAE